VLIFGSIGELYLPSEADECCQRLEAANGIVRQWPGGLASRPLDLQAGRFDSSMVWLDFCSQIEARRQHDNPPRRESGVH